MTEKTQPTIKKKMSKKPLRTAGGHFASKSPSLNLADLPQTFRTRLVLLGEMKKYGFKKAQLQRLLEELYIEAMDSFAVGTITSQLPSNEVLTNAPKGKKDATQMVPISNIQASSMTPNFDSVRSFFLTGHQKHPKHIDWLSAEEIGKLIDKTADQVKGTIAKLVQQERKRELPNNVAMQKVETAGGYFKGVASLVDGYNIPSVIDEELGGMAAWYLMEDGKLVWRNYWSPTIVRIVLDRMGFMSTALPGTVNSQTVQPTI